MADNPGYKFELPPYARSLGIAVEGEENGAPLLYVDFDRVVEGRPGHYHGGATSGLLETAGYAALHARLAKEGRYARFKPINITVQFLSGGKPKRCYAIGRIARLGRRNANLTIEAWQDDRSRPIASAVMNIFMVEEES